MRTTSEGAYRDNDTGEIINIPVGSTIRTPEDRENIKKLIAQKQEQETKNAELADLKQGVCGDFFWSLYNVGENYYPDIPDNLLVKVIYLLTYLDYRKNILVIRDSSTSPYRPMKKEDVKNVIKLHRCNFNAFWEDLISTGIIIPQPDGSLAVTPKFSKGRLNKKDRQDMMAMKIFSHSVRYLYENSDVRSHRYLAYLYRLIPYISLRYNIFCANPLETDHTAIQKMTAKDMCRILGMDEHNQKRLIDTLFKLSFVDKNGDKRSIITVVTNFKNDEKRNFILINPQFYSGYIEKDDFINTLSQFIVDKDDLILPYGRSETID